MFSSIGQWFSEELPAIWDRFVKAFMPDTIEEFNSIAQSLWGGFLTTLELFAMTLLFALPLGLIISFGSMSKFKPLKYFTRL